jgi:hypothetical protein
MCQSCCEKHLEVEIFERKGSKVNCRKGWMTGVMPAQQEGKPWRGKDPRKLRVQAQPKQLDWKADFHLEKTLKA